MPSVPRLVVIVAVLATFGVGAQLRPAAADAATGGICLPANGLMALNDADDLMRGTVRLSSTITVQIGAGDVDWARTDLDFQSAQLLYSLKWVEELVRQSRRSGDQKYLARAVQIAADFARDNPPGGGPDPADAWYPMYAGQRTTALACVADISNDRAVRTALAGHAEWLVGQTGSIADWNQAIPPHLGVLMAGCELDNAGWRNHASDGFARLITTMIDGEGALAEQAPGYGRFVWEQWGNVELEFELCGLTPIQEIPERRAALLQWLAWMSSPDGTPAPIGDTFTTTPPPTPDGSPTAYVVPGGTTGVPPTATQRVFRAGYVVGRDPWDNLPASTYWTLRFGPGRDLHGHEDHTSVTFGWMAANCSPTPVTRGTATPRSGRVCEDLRPTTCCCFPTRPSASGNPPNWSDRPPAMDGGSTRFAIMRTKHHARVVFASCPATA